ncbi:unnamed protein product [Allacma fusca]|uniref:Probable proline--tRNA ligase, mitochondrial n=1 Tax=Allacma fusca TaxID=39272 RepID=A0A8J2P349_9HEXA|nr:unnamed protein product [Allacma fusca]
MECAHGDICTVDTYDKSLNFLLLSLSFGQGRQFRNPILDTYSPDPAVLRFNGSYFMSLSSGNDRTITVLRSPILTDFRNADREVVFDAGSVGLKGLWAPEIHEVEGNIYIYFCLDDGDEAQHRIYVIKADDPNNPLGSYGAPIRMVPHLEDFAIDATVMKHGNGRMYLLWAGIKTGTSILISPLIDPVTVESSYVILRSPTAEWEQIGTPTVEGPFCFYNNSMTYLAFSVGSTWGPDYSMGLMSIPSNKDPMVPSNWWYGINGPIFSRNDDEGVYTTGHATFALSPDGTETWMIYHATNTTEDVINHRNARLEKIDWDESGPVFPRPHGYNSSMALLLSPCNLQSIWISNSVITPGCFNKTCKVAALSPEVRNRSFLLVSSAFTYVQALWIALNVIEWALAVVFSQCFQSPQWLVRSSHSMSSLFRPVYGISAKSKNMKSKNSENPELLSNSQTLMIENGLMRPSSTSGSFTLLPVTMKSMKKLVDIIDQVLSQYSCQKIQMPTITAAGLWKTSGRLDECGKEIMTVTDRHSKKLILSPTHEEAMCEILGDYPWSYRNLPMRLYQITSKFRDEMKPRFGLLRTREFIMKDLYSFDVDENAALETYEAINEAYKRIFDLIGVEYLKVEGTTGMIGGSLSHEYHLLANIGEDKLVTCNACNFAFNVEILNAVESSQEDSKSHDCPKCKSTNTKKHLGIEVGHTFLLGTKYTKSFKNVYLNAEGKSELMRMGCYGIGVTRLLAGVIEVLCVDNQIRWPAALAPYQIAIIPPKSGSKEEPIGKPLAEDLVRYSDVLFPNDVILDDRTELTIGKRLMDLKKLGIPYAIVFGKGVTESIPLIEVLNVNTGDLQKISATQSSQECPFVEELLQYLIDVAVMSFKTPLEVHQEITDYVIEREFHPQFYIVIVIAAWIDEVSAEVQTEVVPVCSVFQHLVHITYR